MVIIPITVAGAKTMRALNCMPLWHSMNVYLPSPDDGRCAWVRDYVQEFLNFPNAAHDDQVDATTLALNQLCGPLFPESKECVVSTEASRPLPDHNYFIGWVPGRPGGTSTLVVYDLEDGAVVHFERAPAESQITRVFETSVTFNYALVRAVDGPDEAMLSALEFKGVEVERLKFSPQDWAAAYENLGMLISNRAISYRYYPELIAELDVFKSDFTYGEAPDYSLQVAQQSGIHALCLAIHDVYPEALSMTYEEVYYSYDPDLIGYEGSEWR